MFAKFRELISQQRTALVARQLHDSCGKLPDSCMIMARLWHDSCCNLNDSCANILQVIGGKNGIFPGFAFVVCPRLGLCSAHHAAKTLKGRTGGVTISTRTPLIGSKFCILMSTILACSFKQYQGIVTQMWTFDRAPTTR